MRARLVLVLLLAAPAALAEPAWLQPGKDPGRQYRERARPASAARLSLVPGGASAGLAPAGTLLTVIEPGPPARVVADGDFVRLAYYVDPAALPLVARKGMVVVAAAANLGAGAGVTTPGVRLRAGTPIDGSPADPGFVRVRFQDPDEHLTVEGIARASAVGSTFVPEPEARPRAEPLILRTPVTLTATLGGAALATVAREGFLDARRVGRARGGRTLVRVASGPAVIVGWVPSASLEHAPRDGTLFGLGAGPAKLGRGSYIGPAHAFHLGAGARLHAAPDGPAVGVVLHEAPYRDFDTAGDDWVSLTVAGPFGDVRLFTPRR
jgi:hypothetical protein